MAAVQAVANPALRADLLLKEVQRCTPSDREHHKDLLDQVFRAAAWAAEPNPVEPVPIGFTDTVPAENAIASNLKVDQLSLRLRAIAELASFDARSAREWFETMSPPQPPALTCANYQVARLDGYYELLRDLNDTAFSPLEVREGQRETFVERHLFPVAAPAQVSGALWFLTRAKLESKSLQRLLSVLAAQLAAIDTDDRSFTTDLLEKEGRRNQLAALIERCRSMDVPVAGLLSAYRQYCARQLRKARCADMLANDHLREREQTVLRRIDAQWQTATGEQAPELVDIVPAKRVESKPPRDLVAATPEYASWYKELVGRKNPAPGHATPAAVFDRVAGEIGDWKKPDDFTSREFFQIKNLVLGRLMQEASGEDERKRAAGMWAAFLGRSEEIEQSEPAVWLNAARGLLSLCRRSGAARDSLYAIVSASGASSSLSALVLLDAVGPAGSRSTTG